MERNSQENRTGNNFSWRCNWPGKYHDFRDDGSELRLYDDLADYPDYHDGNYFYADLLQNFHVDGNADNSRDTSLLREYGGVNHRSCDILIMLLLHDGKYHGFRYRLELDYGHKLENRLTLHDSYNSWLLFR